MGICSHGKELCLHCLAEADQDKDNMETWILIETNRYKAGKGQGSVIIYGVVNSVEAGKDWFDKKHCHRERGCDYCKSIYKWKDEGWRSVKFVDYDGAPVYHEVRKASILD